MLHPWLVDALVTGKAEALSPDDAAWPVIIEQARQNGFSGILNRLLTLQPSLGYCAQPLKAEALRLSASNLFLIEEIKRFLAACASEKIPCVPLRGPVLAELLYDDPTLRPCGDLDVLIRKEAIDAVAGLLKAQGYTVVDRRPGFAREFSNTLECFKENPFHAIIEPHWTIAYPPILENLAMSEVWHRARPAPWLGVPTYALAEDDHLLHLCWHAAHRSHDRPLLWLYDIHCFVEQNQKTLDWGRFLDTASRCGGGWLAASVLSQTIALFHTVITPEILEQLDASTPDTKALRVVENAGVETREGLSAFFALKGWRRKGRYLSGILFPSAVFMRIHYGCSSLPCLAFCYIKRFFSFAAQAVLGLFRSFTGSSRRRFS